MVQTEQQDVVVPERDEARDHPYHIFYPSVRESGGVALCGYRYRGIKPIRPSQYTGDVCVVCMEIAGKR